MNSDRTSPHAHSAGDDSSWETLAENLFGIDLTEDDRAAISDEDLTLDDELLGTAPEESQTSADSLDEPGVAAGNAPAADSTAETPDAGEFDEEADVRLIAGELPADVEVEPQESEDDDYWDPLDDWDWGQEDSEPAADAQAPVQRGRPSGRRERSLSRAAAEDAETDWTEARAEYLDNSDFGAGLLDDGLQDATSGPASDWDDKIAEARTVAPTQSTAGDNETTEEDRREGRRRRRRSGGRHREHGVAPDEPEEEPPSPRFEDEPDEDADAFGAGLSLDRKPTAEDEHADDADEPRAARRSRRRGGKRRRSRDEPVARAAGGDREPADRSESSPPLLDDEEPAAEEEETWGDSDEPADEQRESRYSSVPTWEEAVSLLKGPRRSDADRAPGRSGSRESRSGGRRGRRRR